MHLVGADLNGFQYLKGPIRATKSARTSCANRFFQYLKGPIRADGSREGAVWEERAFNTSRVRLELMSEGVTLLGSASFNTSRVRLEQAKRRLTKGVT